MIQISVFVCSVLRLRRWIIYLQFESEIIHRFETSDGTSQHEHGELKHLEGSETDSIAVRGTYSYVGTDGVTYTVNYVADENGFQPEGAHLPAAPAF